MKKIISLVMACFLLLGLCACGDDPALVGTAQKDNNSADETTDTSTAQTFKLGDSVELNDIVVTFLSINESTGSDFNTPTDGNVFILCEFEITNNSKKELSVSSILNFEAYCDDYACEYSISALMEKENKDQLDGTVAVGKKMKGVVGYEIPADWEELEIHYTLDAFRSDKIVFTATNN